MQVNQIYSLLNDINHQMFGQDAVDVKDLSGIIAMGQSIVGDGTSMDQFLGKLVDRIGKTVIRTLDLELEFPELYMDSYEFGCILQKINVNPMDSIQTSEYTIGNNDFTPTFADIHKPEVTVSYFVDGIDTWKFFVTIPDTLFESAFTSAEQMSNFIDAIIESMTDSLTISLNNMSRTAINNFMAEKIMRGNGVINLVEMYNTAYGLTGDDAITASEAMVSKEFARYASTIIRKYIKYLSKPSVLYNCGVVDGNPIVRATSRDNMHVIFLSDLVSLFDAYLLSDSFKDVYNLPSFVDNPYWEGNHSASGDNLFTVNSSINVVPSSQKDVAAGSKYAIQQSGIVAVIADRQAIAIGLNKMRAGTFSNTIDGYVNQTRTATKQYINDLSENGIIFVVADEIVTPAISLDKSTLTFANSSAADQTITATTIPADASVTWKTSKAAVATVAAGVVSAAGTGSCTITAEITVGGTKLTATCAVTVG